MLLKMKYLIASFPWVFIGMKQWHWFRFTALSKASLSHGFRMVDVLLRK